MLMVLLLLSLLGVAMGGLLATILGGARTSGAMIERRRTFYACDGMGRQLAALGQAFLSRNTLEDVPESQMESELRALLPNVTPPGFDVRPDDLVIPDRPLLDPQPLEMITSGPFAGLEVKMQTIEMRFAATRQGSGAVCRAEQSLSLGRIALFQFFVFADVPLLEIASSNDAVLLRGRMHVNGRLCLSGPGVPTTAANAGGFGVRMDTRITAAERILHGNDNACRFPGGDVGMVGSAAPGNQIPGMPDRLFLPVLAPFKRTEQSGCTDKKDTECPGGWRSFALRRWLGRAQDIEHEVQELTLPVDPPVRFTHRGFAANGVPMLQEMTMSSSRPNNRPLVEPVLATRDPPGFSRNKLAHKAQIRIIDGVWYLKDPGRNNDVAADDDDGPWPGIPIWSDHPGEFTTNTPAMGQDGIEGAVPLQVGQSDIRQALETSTDARLDRTKWSGRAGIGASPTPRRFSHYAFVDRRQASVSGTPLRPPGPGLQFGRVQRGSGGLDVDPPAVISYGGITPVALTTSSSSTYWLPGVRLTDNRPLIQRVDAPRPSSVGWCGGRSDAGAIPVIDPVEDNLILTAVPRPFSTGSSTPIPAVFPAPGSPLPSDGTDVAYASGSHEWATGRLCENDNEDAFRHRMRLALLESARTGFRDTNSHSHTRFPGPRSVQGDILPLNFNLHAFQEALADRTPGELGSFFCEGCLWERFTGSVWIGTSWRGSMLTASGFPDGVAAPPPSPLVDDVDVLGKANAQPKVPNEDRSTTGPLPYPLCAANSDEASSALAQVVGHRFLEADEVVMSTGSPRTTFGAAPFDGNGTLVQFVRGAATPTMPTSMSPPEPAPTAPAVLPNDIVTPDADGMRTTFTIPSCAHYSLVSGPLADVRPTAVRLINGRTLHFNRAVCGAGSERCHPELSNVSSGAAVPAVGQLDDGLNIVTHLPLYVVGDMNVTSEIDNVQTGQKATDWIPFMVAGDTVTTLSNSWSDQGSRWRVEPDFAGFSSQRTASSTRYHMLVLTGLATAGEFRGLRSVQRVNDASGGLLGALRLMEDWSGANHRFRGSFVLGWMPVYTQWRVGPPGRESYVAPSLRDWQFDRHLNATVNQPPDSPVFDVTALRSWRRE